MNKITTFIKESVEEIRSNVNWPSFGELQSSSVLVVVASLVFALAIFGIDYLFEGSMATIYQSFINEPVSVNP